MPLLVPLFGLLLAGCGVGLLSALLGIGGGLVMVPLLTWMGLPIASATATSLVAVFLSSLSATLRNVEQRDVDGRVAIGLSLSGMVTAQFGAAAAARLPDRPVSLGFALLLGLTIYLMGLKRQLNSAAIEPNLVGTSIGPVIAIGSVAGLLSGLFGVGGGVIMVPLQLLALGSPIKAAVRTSLGAIVLISLSGLVQGAINHQVHWLPGICLGLGGVAGAQVGARWLPSLADRWVDRLFRVLCVGLAIYMVLRVR
jgi:uncharacterized protein